MYILEFVNKGAFPVVHRVETVELLEDELVAYSTRVVTPSVFKGLNCIVLPLKSWREFEAVKGLQYGKGYIRGTTRYEVTGSSARLAQYSGIRG